MIFGWGKNQKLAIGLFTDEPSNVTIENYRSMPRIVQLEQLNFLIFSSEQQKLLEQITNTSTVFAGTRSQYIVYCSILRKEDKSSGNDAFLKFTIHRYKEKIDEKTQKFEFPIQEIIDEIEMKIEYAPSIFGKMNIIPIPYTNFFIFASGYEQNKTQNEVIMVQIIP